MRVIIAVDGSRASKDTIAAVLGRYWAAGTSFRILSVIPFPLSYDDELDDDENELLERQFQKRKNLIEARCRRYQRIIEQSLPHCSVHIQLKEGNPPPEIIKVASEWIAEKLIIGRFQSDTCDRCVWGSVSKAVTLRAPCAVDDVTGSSSHRDVRTAC